MAGISSKAAGKLTNKRKFNGGSELHNNEFADGNGIELYSTNYRLYDHQIGRFVQIDPIADIAESNSPFVFANNNPILFNDPYGLADSTNQPGFENSRGGVKANLEEVVVTSNKKGKSNGSSFFFYGTGSKASSDNTRVVAPITGSVIPGTYIPGATANLGLSQPAYPRTAVVRQFRTTRMEKFIRVSNSIKGNLRGSWLVRASSIQGLSPWQIQQSLALPEIPDQLGEVEVPSGTLLRAGPVGGNSFGPGNIRITQYQLMEQIPDASFKTPMPLRISGPMNIPYESIPDEIPEIEIPEITIPPR